MSKKPIEKRCYRGKTISKILTEEEKARQTGSEKVIIHVGTNDLNTDRVSAKGITENLEKLGSCLEKKTEKGQIIISLIITREDKNLEGIIKEANNEIKGLCERRKWTYIDNTNIDSTCLNGSRIHLNKKGNALLATNIIRTLRGGKQPSPNDRKSQSFRKDQRLGLPELLELVRALR